MTPATLSVSELTASIKAILEPNFRGISVQGEISNFKAQPSGHLYFSLKDKESQISCVLFRNQVATLPKMPKDGDQVILKGELSIFPPRGAYQLIARELQFLGVGELLVKLHQLKETLQRRGWFDPAYKKRLPKLPKTVGVITSPTGAVIQDILHVLTRRFSGVQVLLLPVKVQGEGAAIEIAKAIEAMNRFDLVDVLIVGRGGGSIEDLWAFNEEIVAKAIFSSKIPIISAVGHETDVTIADFVADVRAPTPSAAAEIVISEKEEILKTLEKLKMQLRSYIRMCLDQRKSKFSAISYHPVLSQPQTLLAHKIFRLDDAKEKTDLFISSFVIGKREKLRSIQQSLSHLRPSKQIAQLREKLSLSQLRLDETMKRTLYAKKIKSSLEQTENYLIEALQRSFACKQDLFFRVKNSLSSLHPNNLLRQGYSLLFSEKDNSLILSVRDLQPRETFRALLADGQVRSSALQIEEFHGSHL